jgi:L-iditol 2-dehydrogenase
MKAAVLVDVNRIEVRDVPAADVAPHEVRVRVAAVGLCGTDLHIAAGHGNYHRDANGRVIPLDEAPQILGHEIAGVVTEVGRDVRDVREGARVIVDQGRTCVGERRDPRCEYCATGDSHQCEHYREHGITGLPGGLAEELVVPAPNVSSQAPLRWINPRLGCPGYTLTHVPDGVCAGLRGST